MVYFRDFEQSTITHVRGFLLLFRLPLNVTLAHDIRGEICWVLLNAIECGTDAQTRYFIDEGCLVLLCDMLMSTDERKLCLVLKSLETILRMG